MTARRPLLGLLVFAVGLALALPATAAPQDPASYPAGVTEVSNSPVLPDDDFQVTVRTSLASPTVAVYVCHFQSMAQETPDECYMPMTATAQAGAFVADTKGRSHPAWKDGWVLGYKVTVRAGDAERHAPDRTTSAGDQDYYRLVVGSTTADPAPQGSAEVVDDAPAATVATPPAPSQSAGSASLGAALALTGALALARARRR